MAHTDRDLEEASEWVEHWKEIFAANPEAEKCAEAYFCPPEPSGDEHPAPEDPAFLAACHADVMSMSKGPVVWEDQLLTRSPTWGLIWRADFWDPKIVGQLYPSRVTCWKNDNGELGMTISGLQYGKLELKPCGAAEDTAPPYTGIPYTTLRKFGMDPEMDPTSDFRPPRECEGGLFLWLALHSTRVTRPSSARRRLRGLKP